jgi:HEAT repeat protein
VFGSRRVRMTSGFTLVLAGWLSFAGGCQENPQVRLSRTAQMRLESRALDLLLRAAGAEDSITACNAIEALVRVAPRDGRPAFRRAVHAQNPLIRYAGYAALGEMRDRESLPLILAGARDSHAHVRLAAAFAAYRCGKTGAARALVQALTHGTEEALRADAATLIGRLGEPRAKAWLQAALDYPANEDSKRATLAIHAALARLGDAESLTELIRYTQGDLASRTEALLLLAELGDIDGLDALLYHLEDPQALLEARLIAARGLGKLNQHDGFELALQHLDYVDPKPDRADPAPNFRVRSMAAHALAEIGDPRALPALEQIAADRRDPRLQVAACYAICRITQK